MTPFQTPSAILGPPGGHLGFCRRCGVAGGERVPPLPLGWYSWDIEACFFANLSFFFCSRKGFFNKNMGVIGSYGGQFFGWTLLWGAKLGVPKKTISKIFSQIFSQRIDRKSKNSSKLKKSVGQFDPPCLIKLMFWSKQCCFSSLKSIRVDALLTGCP